MAEKYDVVGIRFKGVDEGLISTAIRADKAVSDLEISIERLEAASKDLTFSKTASEIDGATSSMAKYSREQAEAIGRAKALQASLADQTQQLGKFENAMRKTAKALSDVYKRMAEAAKAGNQSAMDELAKDANRLANELSAQRKELVRIASVYAKTYSAIDKTGDATDQLITANKKLSAELESIDDALGRQAASLQKSLAHYNVFESENKELADSLKELSVAIERAEDALEAHNKAAPQATEKAAQLEAEISKLKAEYTSTNNELTESIENMNFYEEAMSRSVDSIDSLVKSEKQLNAQLNENIDRLKRRAEEMRAAGRAIEEFGQGINDIGRVVTRVGIGLSAFTTVPFILGMKSATTAAIDFESGLAGVLKTVDDAALGGTSQLTKLGEEMARGFRDLALIMPATTTELLAIGEVAGQLGIPAQQIVGFTEIIAEFAESTNVTAEVASKAMAQIANIFGVAENDLVRFADAATNAIVDLGNNFATTESDILSFFQTFAGGAAAFNVTAAAALGIATAFKSVRAQTASSSTGIQKTFVAMARAVDIGGESLEKFAIISNMSAEQFIETWRTDPAKAFEAFVIGLDDAGDSAAGILRDIGLGDQRIIREFLKIANASEVLTSALNRSQEAFGNFGDQGARATEAARRFATTESQIAILKNTMNDLAIEIGQTLLPIFKDLVDAVVPVIESFTALAATYPNLVEGTIILGGLVAAMGPVTTVAGAMLTTFAGMVEGVGSMVNALGTMRSVLIDASKGLEASSSMADVAKIAIKNLGKEFNIAGQRALMFKLAVGGIVAAGVVAGVVYLTAQIAKAQREAVDLVDRGYEVSRTFRDMDESSRDLNESLVKNTTTYAEYTENVKNAGSEVQQLTEDQWELVVAMDSVAAASEPAAAAIQAYLDIDRGPLGFLINYNDAYLELSNILLTTTQNTEEYERAVQQLIDTQSQLDVENVFFTPGPLAELISQLVAAGYAAGATNEEISNTVMAFAEASGTTNQLKTQINGLNVALEKTAKSTGIDIELSIDGAGNVITSLNEVDDSSVAATKRLNNLLNEVQKLAKINISAFSFADMMLRDAEAAGASKDEMVALLTAINDYDSALTRVTIGQKDADMVMRVYNENLQRLPDSYTDAEKQAIALEKAMKSVAVTTFQTSEAMRIAQELAKLFGSDADNLVAQFMELSTLQDTFAGLAGAGLVEDAKEVHDQIIELNQGIIDSYNELSFNIAKVYLGQADTGLNLLSKEALDFAVALGTMTEAEAAAIQETQRINDIMLDLGNSIQSAKLNAREFAAAAFLIQQGMADSADEAIGLLRANDGLVDSVLESKAAFEAAASAMSDQSSEAALLREQLISLAKAQDEAAGAASNAIEQVIRNANRTAGGAGRAVALELDEMANAFVGFISNVEDGEPIVENWSRSLLDSAAAAGASLEEVALLAIATGELSDEQAAALLNQLAAQKAIEAIAEAYVSGSISAEEAASAVGTLQDQLEAGADIDLSQFGISMVESSQAIESAAGGAGESMRSLVDIYKEALFDIVTANNDFESEAELDLQVELGQMTIDEAEAIKAANATVEGLRNLFGTLVIDGVPVDAILDVGEIQNIGEFVEEFSALVENDPSVADGIDILIGATVELGLSDAQRQDVVEQYIAEVKSGVEGQTAEEVALTMSYALVAAKGESLEDVIPDELLQDGIEIAVSLENKDEVDQALRDQADLIGEYTGADNPNELVIDTTSVTEADLVIQELQTKINTIKEGAEVPFIPDTAEVDKVISGFENLDITVKVKFVADNQVEAPSGGTAGQGTSPPGYYKGGHVKGQYGIDKILAYLTHGEYVVPAKVVKQPGVLDMLKSLSGAVTGAVQTRVSPVQGPNNVRTSYNYQNDYSNRRIVNVNVPRRAGQSDKVGRITAGMVGAIRGTAI